MTTLLNLDPSQVPDDGDGLVYNAASKKWLPGAPPFAGVAGLVYSQVATDGTDQTAALQAELDALRLAGGGTLVLPTGTIRCDGTLTLTNDGATPAKQPALTLVGTGPHWSGRGTAPIGGTIIDIRGTDTYGKIKTNGLGLLSLHRLTLRNSNASSSTPFLYTTNTTLRVTECAFVGAKAGVNCDQDAIILGGPNQLEGGNGWTDGFQGYGTVISECFFSNIRRGVVGRAYANAVVVRDCTWWTTCGHPTGAAIEWDGAPAGGVQKATGVVLMNNLIETPNYQYAVKMANAERCSVVHNNVYDSGAGTLAAVRMETTAQFNLIVAGFCNGSLPYMSDASGKNTVHAIAQGTEHIFSQGASVYRTFGLGPDGGPAAATFSAASNGRIGITNGTGGMDLLGASNPLRVGPLTNRLSIFADGTNVWLDALGHSSNANVSIRVRAKGSGVILAESNLSMNANMVIRPGFGTTANRPAISGSQPAMWFDTTLGKPIWWNGVAWIDATGATV